MRRLVAFWVAFWAVLGVGFWQADKHGWALCSAVRYVFGTHERRGRIKLAGSLFGGGIVLYRHLVKPGTFNTLA